LALKVAQKGKKSPKLVTLGDFYSNHLVTLVDKSVILFRSFFQDFANKPQYILVLEKGTSSVSYFSGADPNSNREAAIIW